MQIAVCTYGCFLGSGDVKVSRMQEASDCCSVPSHSCVSLAKGIGLVGGEMHEPAAMDIDAMIQVLWLGLPLWFSLVSLVGFLGFTIAIG